VIADRPENSNNHPKYRLTTRLACLVALGLMLLGLAKAGWAQGSDLPAEVLQGQKLFQRLGCRSCHALNNQGGGTGPPLDGIGQRLSYADLEQQVTEPSRRHPRSGMPSFAFLRPAELSALINYLQTLK